MSDTTPASKEVHFRSDTGIPTIASCSDSVSMGATNWSCKACGSQTNVIVAGHAGDTVDATLSCGHIAAITIR